MGEVEDGGKSLRMEACRRAGIKQRCTPRLRPFLPLALVLHVGAQHRIHPSLIACAFVPEEIEHVFIDADRDGFLLRRNHENGFRPVEIERHCVGVVANGLLDFFIGERVNCGPISLPPSGSVPRDRCKISAFRLSARALPR